MAVAAASLALAPSAAAHGGGGGDRPAGGAAIEEAAIATVAAAIACGLLVAMGVAHRRGRIRLLAHAGAWAERKWRVPAWAALPGAISLASLLVALLGMYWDISLHINDGRDPGPLANPAHYLILIGLFGVFAAGFMSMVLATERPSASAVRLARSWYAPLGGLLLFAAAAFALLGFPLDDFWHRLFGQDVTLWGPTHLMLFGGAALTLIGRSVLLVEGERAVGEPQGGHPLFIRLQKSALMGGLLIGLSTFQGEFDFGVPQFQLVFHPMLIAFAAALALVTARIWGGPGAAFVAVAMFLAIRGLVAVLVGPGFGETMPHFPLYLAEAAIVELVALRISVARPLALGGVCGLLIGTVGVAAEWAWSHVWMPIPWPEALLPEAVIAALVAALSGGLLGGLIGASLASDRVAMPRLARPALVAATLALAGVTAYGLSSSSPDGLRAEVDLRDVQAGSERSVAATARLEPRDGANDAKWLTVTAWQGEGFHLDHMERVREGVYRTSEPVPVHGDWKAMIRLHRGNQIAAVPIFLPRDEAIPAPAIPAERSFTREFVEDTEILQREARDASGAITAAGYLVVLAFAAALYALMAWGLSRLARHGRAAAPLGPREPVTAAPPPARRPVAAGR